MNALKWMGVVAALVLAPTAAQAGVPIPCTGETLVKVVDVPAFRGMKIKANADLDEKRLDLGYKFIGCFGGGQWVGYLGHSTRYLPLDDKMLQGLVQAAGLKQLPPVPSRLFYWEPMKIPLLWVGILGFGIIFGQRSQRNAKAAQPAPAGADPNAAVNTALAEHLARRSQAAPPSAPRRTPAVTAARPGFGRRG